jgi:phosphotransferase system enzyme I (PtsI)
MVVTADVAVPRGLVRQMRPLLRPTDGLGLVRTEYLFVGSQHWPTAVEQQAAYESLLVASRCRRARFRLFDITRHKTPWATDQQSEHDGTAYLLRHPDLLIGQMTSIAAACRSFDVSLEIVAPFVVTPEQGAAVTAAAHSTQIERVAIMLETPASVTLAHLYLQDATSALIGLGDLVPLIFGIARGAPEDYPDDDLALESVTRLLPQGHVLRDGPSRVGVCGAANESLALRIALALGLSELVVPYSTVASYDGAAEMPSESSSSTADG